MQSKYSAYAMQPGLSWIFNHFSLLRSQKNAASNNPKYLDRHSNTCVHTMDLGVGIEINRY